jgi:ferredoxin
VAAAAAAAAAATPAAAVEPEKAPASEEPYIETPRCSSCDECIQINNKMFAYDANKQARVVDPRAGTYRQLVEAAESCQVAIIHPGNRRTRPSPASKSCSSAPPRSPREPPGMSRCCALQGGMQSGVAGQVHADVMRHHLEAASSVRLRPVARSSRPGRDRG